MVCLDFFFCQKSVFVNEKLSLIGHAFKLTVDDVELSIWQDERISVSDTTLTFYFKLPYIGPFFVVDIKLVFSSFKIVNKLVWKTLSLVGPVRVWFTSFYVGETSAPQHLSIYPRVCMSTWSVMGPLTFSDTYKILNYVALYVLTSVLAS